MKRNTRYLLKTISWRITGTLDTILISYLVTGSITQGTTIGMIELATKMVLYYGHEWLWDRGNNGSK
jgi:Predicted membrane protein